MADKVRRTPPEVLHENPFSKVIRVGADFGTFQKTFYITHFGPRVGVVAVKDGRLLMVRQYRLLIDAESLEIPGGAIEVGETPEQAIARELLEEAGIACRDPRPLVTYYPGLDNVENRTSVFYSEDVEVVRPFVADPRETVGLSWVSLEDCAADILAGRQMDALTIVGVMSYLRLRASR